MFREYHKIKDMIESLADIKEHIDKILFELNGQIWLCEKYDYNVVFVRATQEILEQKIKQLNELELDNVKVQDLIIKNTLKRKQND